MAPRCSTSGCGTGYNGWLRLSVVSNYGSGARKNVPADGRTMDTRTSLRRPRMESALASRIWHADSNTRDKALGLEAAS